MIQDKTITKCNQTFALRCDYTFLGSSQQVQELCSLLEKKWWCLTTYDVISQTCTLYWMDSQKISASKWHLKSLCCCEQDKPLSILSHTNILLLKRLSVFFYYQLLYLHGDFKQLFNNFRSPTQNVSPQYDNSYSYSSSSYQNMDSQCFKNETEAFFNRKQSENSSKPGWVSLYFNVRLKILSCFSIRQPLGLFCILQALTSMF